MGASGASTALALVVVVFVFGGVVFEAGFFCFDAALATLCFEVAAVDYAKNLSGKWYFIFFIRKQGNVFY